MRRARWGARACRLPPRRTSTSSSRRSRRSSGADRPRPVARLPPGARPLRPAPGRRADDPREDPAGRAVGRAARRAGGSSRALLPRLRPHHDAAEHPVPLRAARRRRARLRPPGGRGADDPGGVRQLRAQHHRVPVRRRVAGRGVRRHAVRRGADALLPAPPALVVSAAQVQDRLRGLPRRSRLCRHQRHRLVRGGARDATAGASWGSGSPSAAARRR